MIGIAKDYAAIGIGAATVASVRAVELGRSTVSSVGSLAHLRHGPARAEGLESLRDAGYDLRATTERSRELIAAMIQSELERFVARVGLVPESELNALRQQVERLERQLADAKRVQA